MKILNNWGENYQNGKQLLNNLAGAKYFWQNRTIHGRIPVGISRPDDGLGKYKCVFPSTTYVGSPQNFLSWM